MSLQEKVEQRLQASGRIYQLQEGEILTQYVDLAGNPVVEYRIRIVDDQIQVSHPGATPLVFSDVVMFGFWLDI
ncbi:hypothetical protein [Aeromonas salmonicida]|uniref:hypothetical protein n=1 Tax=Aeromonas TaxID=642 RepID=UPI00224059F6|nr:hypothetical protein [Aeromonas salmonicida]